MKRIAVSTLRAYLIFLFMFCFILIPPTLAADSKSPATPSKVQDVVIGTQVWPGALPIYVAIAKGFTQDEGINVSRIIVSSGANRRSALLAGEIQFAELAFSNVAVAVARNAPIKYVMSTYDFETFSLIVRSGLKDQVRSVKDLKGKTVGFTTPGAGAWAWARVYLIAGGLKPGDDVAMVGGISKVGVVLAALQSGKVDAFPSWEPITSIAIDRGLAYPLIPIWQPEVHKKWVGETAFGSGLAVSTKMISERPDVIRHMVSAIKAALKYMNGTPPTEIAAALAQHPKTKETWASTPKKILVEMIEKSRSAYLATDGRISRSGVESEVKIATETGILKKALSFSELADTQFSGVKP